MSTRKNCRILLVEIRRASMRTFGRFLALLHPPPIWKLTRHFFSIPRRALLPWSASKWIPLFVDIGDDDDGGDDALRPIFHGQRRRRSGRLGLHHDARNSPAAGFFDRLNAVDAAPGLLAVAVQCVAAP
jgi:hypothetical protein